MTSYSHYTDEAFKIYTANKIVNGAKFLILQHGHQGHHNYCGTFYEKKFVINTLRGNNQKIIRLYHFSLQLTWVKKLLKRNLEVFF